ncbi:MAG: hypothetical protein PHQ22_02215 [Sulfuricurvum sp.]|nr:hypothetical protein [Sulfuricurvum sp.]MDD5385989.1 hypothetical protein [Sulfuricurvum sp.]
MNMLVVVLSSQLLYYLLIAQTGVVGAFDSHLYDLYTLPIGGVTGSLFAAYWKHLEIKEELFFMFGTQIMISWFYPDYSLGLLLVLGFIVGYTTPLLLYGFREQSRKNLALGLALSYAVGTALYTYPFEERGGIAIVLPTVSMIALYFSTLPMKSQNKRISINWKMIGVMVVWIFADSALFETLSRSSEMDIWSHYTAVIIASHLLGVYLAFRYGKTLMRSSGVIIGLFTLSYGVYYAHQPILLAIVYPIIISYYNVLLFRELTQMGDVRSIGIAMVGVGWGASSIANLVALYHQLWIALAVLGTFAFIYPFYFRRTV